MYSRELHGCYWGFQFVSRAFLKYEWNISGAQGVSEGPRCVPGGSMRLPTG